MRLPFTDGLFDHLVAFTHDGFLIGPQGAAESGAPKAFVTPVTHQPEGVINSAVLIGFLTYRTVHPAFSLPADEPMMPGMQLAVLSLTVLQTLLHGSRQSTRLEN